MELILIGLLFAFALAIFITLIDNFRYDTVWFIIDSKRELLAYRSLGHIKGICFRQDEISQIDKTDEKSQSVIVISVRLSKWYRHDERTPSEHLENLIGIMRAKNIEVFDSGCN
jgi:hypothetical protein